MQADDQAIDPAIGVKVSIAKHKWKERRDLAVEEFEPAGASRLAPKSESRNWDQIRCYPASGSLIAEKFSLLRRLGNSVGKRLNLFPKAKASWLSQARNRQISLYFPVEQGNQRAETGSLMTGSSAKIPYVFSASLLTPTVAEMDEF